MYSGVMSDAVPLEDERNNARMAFDTLLNKVDIPPGQIHVMDTDLSPEAAAMEYEEELFEYFGTDVLPDQTFDLVLLGMGDDGHTLSLFPGTPLIHEEKSWVVQFFSQGPGYVSDFADKKNRQSGQFI